MNRKAMVLGIVFTALALKNYLDTYKSIMKGSYLPNTFTFI